MVIKNTPYLLKISFLLMLTVFAFTGCETDEPISEEEEIIIEEEGDDEDPIDPNLYSRPDSGFRLRQFTKNNHRADGSISFSVTRNFEYDAENLVTRSFLPNNDTYNDYNNIKNISSAGVHHSNAIHMIPSDNSRSYVDLSTDLDGKIRFRYQTSNTVNATHDYEYKDGIVEIIRFDAGPTGHRINLTFLFDNGEIYESRNGSCDFGGNFCEDRGVYQQWNYNNVSGYMASEWLYSDDTSSGRYGYNSHLNEVPLAPLPSSRSGYDAGNQVQRTEFTYELDVEGRVTKRRENYFLPDGTPFGHYVEYLFVW